MTEQVMRKLIGDALNISAIEEELVEIIRDNLDPEAIAKEIWDTWQDEIIEQAAQVAAEEFLPF